MRIFLRGGTDALDGQYRDVHDVCRQFSEDGWYYKPTGETTAEGIPIFRFDETATMRGNHLPSRDEAIADANEKYRGKFGNGVQFPDGADGHGMPGSLSP